MSRKRKPHYKNRMPTDPAVKRFYDWLPANRSFYGNFRQWLRDSGYSSSALNIYGVAARYALGLLDKPYWTIDPEADLDHVWDRIVSRDLRPSTKEAYHKGLSKFGQYLSIRLRKPEARKEVNWGYYIGSLPDWMAWDIREYIAHCQRSWPPERKFEVTISALSHLTLPLRWIAARYRIENLEEITPPLWFAYVDARMNEGIKPITLNGNLSKMHAWLKYLKESGRPICERMLRIRPLSTGHRLPRDIAVEHLRLLMDEIRMDISSPHGGVSRTGTMDMAWFLLMIHSGLRTGEVRRLQLQDINWIDRRVRIEQSKGLKDRVVPFSHAAGQALKAYLEVRGPPDSLADLVFIYRHQSLSKSYCYQRLRTYARRCGVRATPQLLRHSCATMLLNAGAPIVTVQKILGHKHVNTTLGYARLYDGTVAADYHRAMAHVEMGLKMQERKSTSPASLGHMAALVGSLCLEIQDDAQLRILREVQTIIQYFAQPS